MQALAVDEREFFFLVLLNGQCHEIFDPCFFIQLNFLTCLKNKNGNNGVSFLNGIVCVYKEDAFVIVEF